MATQARVHGPASPSITKPLIGGIFFDVVFLIVSIWLIGGTYADAWAHNHLKLDTFFTPWHGILYTGVLAVALTLATTVVLNRRRGASWQEAIPAGYDLSLVAIFAMFFVGVGDGIWHTLFGIEMNTDAMMSPTHLAAVVCITLAISGPYRAMYRRAHQPSGSLDTLLLGLALALLLGEITNYTQEFHPYTSFWPLTAPRNLSLEQAFAIVSFVFQAIVVTGLALYSIRRWRLGLGFFTLVMTLVAIPLSLMHDHSIVILIAFLGGMISDAAYFFLKPSLARQTQFRVFSVILSAGVYVVYMGAMVMIGGVVWSVHMVIGSIVATALAGWLLSYLVLPAQLPEGVSDYTKE